MGLSQTGSSHSRCGRCRRPGMALCRRGVCRDCAWSDYLALRDWITPDDKAKFMVGWESAL